MENNYLHLFSAFFAICIPLTCIDFINVNWLLRWQETQHFIQKTRFISIYIMEATGLVLCVFTTVLYWLNSELFALSQDGAIWKLILNQPYSCLLCSSSHNLRMIYLFILIRCRAYEWANIFFFANAFKKATDKIPSAFVLACCLTTKQKTASTC